MSGLAPTPDGGAEVGRVLAPWCDGGGQARWRKRRMDRPTACLSPTTGHEYESMPSYYH